MKIIESEVSTGNMSGNAGVPSIPFNRGFHFYGGNNGSPGIKFTPDGEPSFKSYKSMKHSKKNLKKRMKKIKLFKDYLKEDATVSAGNTGGMGNVVGSIPSSIPGDVAGSIPGSGDIGQTFGTFMKPNTFGLKKKKKKKNKMKKIESYDNFQIDNFTAKYYDNYDDEDDSKLRNDINEEFENNYTFECSGSPAPTFSTKSNFFDFMENHGFKHTTLNKKTNMLIVEHKGQNTLKCQKAEKYGIPIYTYKEAKKKVIKLSEDLQKYNM